MGNRKVICADAAVYLRQATVFDSVVTSLPDAEETGMDINEWRRWFVEMVALCAGKARHYAIFYQTDRKANGHLFSKAELVFKGLEKSGSNIIWHKIVLRRQPGMVDLYRPGFTHLICASKTGKCGKATPDVFERGKMIYDNAMGLNAVQMALSFIRNNCKSKEITDPFCGKGTIVAAAEKMGFTAVGVDIDPAQCQAAEKLRFK